MADNKTEKRKVERVFIDAKTGKQVAAATVATDAKDVATQVTIHHADEIGDPGPRRAIAIVLFVLGIVFELLALLVFNGTLEQTFPGNPMIWLIVFIVLDLIAVVIGSQLWKKANHMDPPSEANKVSFFLKSQLGAILSVVAFLPLVILILTDKNADKQMKTVGGIAAAIALVIAVGTGADFSPVSAEDVEAAQQNAIELGDGTVYWTPSGHVYHLNPNCQAIINSTDIYQGTAAEAMAAGRDRACKFCAEASGSDVMKDLASTESTVAEEPEMGTEDGTAEPEVDAAAAGEDAEAEDEEQGQAA